MLYPWFESLLTRCSELKQTAKLHHALLCITPSGFGVHQLAAHLAKMLMCDNLISTGACGACRNCHLISKNNHPDYLLLSDDQSIIKVDQIRAINTRLGEKSQLGGNTVVIFESCERMNLASANALLKMLEEPPNNTYFVLTCESLEQLLPTIRSRCLTLTLPNDAQEQALNWVSSNNIALNDFKCARNQPLFAQAMSEPEWQSVKQELINAMHSQSPVVFAEKLKNHSLEKIIWWFEWWLESAAKSVFIVNEDGDELIFRADDIRKIYLQWDHIIDMKRKLANHVSYNTQMLLEDLYIRFKPLMQV